MKKILTWLKSWWLDPFGAAAVNEAMSDAVQRRECLNGEAHLIGACPECRDWKLPVDYPAVDQSEDSVPDSYARYQPFAHDRTPIVKPKRKPAKKKAKAKKRK